MQAGRSAARAVAQQARLEQRRLDVQPAPLEQLDADEQVRALPGSTGAVKDGWDGILADQLDSRHRPCNFVELMPRLTER